MESTGLETGLLVDELATSNADGILHARGRDRQIVSHVCCMGGPDSVGRVQKAGMAKAARRMRIDATISACRKRAAELRPRTHCIPYQGRMLAGWAARRNAVE